MSAVDMEKKVKFLEEEKNAIKKTRFLGKLIS